MDSVFQYTTVKFNIDSSVIDRAAHNAHTDEMLVQFKNGNQRLYEDVGFITFRNFIEADSVGQYYNSVFKGTGFYSSAANFDGYQRVEDEPLTDWERELLEPTDVESDIAADYGTNVDYVFHGDVSFEPATITSNPSSADFHWYGDNDPRVGYASPEPEKFGYFVTYTYAGLGGVIQNGSTIIKATSDVHAVNLFEDYNEAYLEGNAKANGIRRDL